MTINSPGRIFSRCRGCVMRVYRFFCRVRNGSQVISIASAGATTMVLCTRFGCLARPLLPVEQVEAFLEKPVHIVPLQVGKPAPLAVLVYERQALDIFSQTTILRHLKIRNALSQIFPVFSPDHSPRRAILLFDVGCPPRSGIGQTAVIDCKFINGHFPDSDVVEKVRGVCFQLVRVIGFHQCDFSLRHEVLLPDVSSQYGQHFRIGELRALVLFILRFRRILGRGLAAEFRYECYGLFVFRPQVRMGLDFIQILRHRVFECLLFFEFYAVCFLS